MRWAARISAKAHLGVMRACKPNKKEYELEGVFIQECYQEGCREMAYTPIVGGGNNACTLHYIKNDQPLRAGELVLVDAGCEYHYYASDITRTIPINGKFSTDQKLIYECVLKAQICAIQEIKPGTAWDKLQEIIVNVLVEGLVSLGILHGNIKTLIQEKAYKRFYMHGSGHWLGLDVHDVGEYKMEGKWRQLVSGMVLTVEPGLYIWPDETVDKRWWGIGVRIEDDVLVTDTGYEVLSKGVPKTVKEIEQLMALSNH
jgi:Xaa-Pro aminopeptidase